MLETSEIWPTDSRKKDVEGIQKCNSDEMEST